MLNLLQLISLISLNLQEKLSWNDLQLQHKKCFSFILQILSVLGVFGVRLLTDLRAAKLNACSVNLCLLLTICKSLVLVIHRTSVHSWIVEMNSLYCINTYALGIYALLYLLVYFACVVIGILVTTWPMCHFHLHRSHAYLFRYRQVIVSSNCFLCKF